MLCPTNICQNNGKCFINYTMIISYCSCNRCFTGKQCKIERYSKNLWVYGILEENKIYFNPRNEQIIL
ncbi:unnamed protein product, partial [Rotaria sp. Silwood1]